MEFLGDDFTSVAENFLESCSKDLELSGKFWNNPGSRKLNSLEKKPN
jgi:hypothetical protein